MNVNPAEVLSILPEGGDATPIFEAFGVESMVVSHDGRSIAFSAADPEADVHYVSDPPWAIRTAFVYDVDTQTMKAVTAGNVHDT